MLYFHGDRNLSPSRYTFGLKHKKPLTYKKYIDDESFQKQYMRYKFNPLYESIGYYSFGYIDNIYENLSLVNTSSEFKWYNKSQIKLI